MFKNESADQSSIEELQQDETPIVKRPGPEEILGLISNFLETSGNVLLIQGPPGAGKTTLALDLLGRVRAARIGRNEVPPTRVYIPSRVSHAKLRKHFSWMRDMVDPSPSNSTADDPSEGLH